MSPTQNLRFVNKYRILGPIINMAENMDLFWVQKRLQKTPSEHLVSSTSLFVLLKDLQFNREKITNLKRKRKKNTSSPFTLQSL